MRYFGVGFARKLTALALAAVLLFSAGARVEAANVVETILGLVIVQTQSRQALNYMDGEGRQQLLEEYKKTEGVNTDPGMNQMLDRIMTSMQPIMLKENPSLQEKPYRYFVNEQDSFNAFCAIGNILSVNKGVFLFCQNNEDQVTAVVAHELAHGQKRHPQAGAKKTLDLMIAQELLTIGANQGTAALVGLTATHIKASGITKPKEVEADNLSFGYMVEAGYNVGATAAVWQRILEREGKASKDFFSALLNPSTHPGTKWRRDNFSKKITEYSNKQIVVDAETGEIKIKGQIFMKPGRHADMSGLERAYLIAGRLARLYSSYGKVLPPAVAAGGTVKIKDMLILTVTDNDSDAEELAARLNKIAAGERD